MSISKDVQKTKTSLYAVIKNMALYEVAGLISFLIGITVIAGWHAGNEAVTQIIPDQFAPMQYNTALGFAACGIGLWLLSKGHRVFSYILAGFVVCLSGLTLAEYIFSTDLGIDNLIVAQDAQTKTSHPGRPSPATALCFLLSALSLLAIKKPLLSFNFSASVLLITCCGIASYIPVSDDIYGWGTLSRMAPHTLFGFAIISSALVRYNFNKWEKAWHIWSVVPSAVSFFVIIITLFAAYTVREASLEQNRKYFETLISDTEIALLSRFEQYEQSLWGGLGLFYASDHVSRDEWRRYVEALNIDVNLPGINGIGYIDFVHANDLPDYLAVTRADEADEFTNHPATNLDEKFIVKYVEPLSRNDDIIGLDIGFEEKRRTAAERARDTGEPALSRGIQLVQNQAKQATGFLLLLPVYATHNTPATIQARRQSFTGWVYANFVASRFVEDLSKIVHKEVDFQIYDGNRHDDDHRIYETQENLLPSGRFSKVTALNLAGQTWTIYWQPSAAFVPPADQSTTYFVAIFGMLFSAFLYYTLQALVKNKSIIEREKKQLQDSEAKMHAIVDNTVDALITIDENGAIESFNIACEEMFGYSAQDVIGSNVKILMPEPYHAEHDGYLHNYHSTGRKKIIGIGREVQARRKNGDIFPIDLSVSEVTVQDRKIFSGIIRDITERKKSEEEILRSNTELERFAYVASHDLQEPLRMVTNFTGLLERQYGDKLDDTAKEYIRYAYDGGRRMQELVNDLLEYARLGQEAESVKSVNLNGLMILVKENLKESIDASGAVIDYDELPIVSATPVRLLRVMQNLIGNAMKYQAPDAKPHITISAKEDNGIWEIALRDNGIGMKPEYCEKIFEPFKRLHAKHEYSGTGMGLSICRKIIEGFDGTIWATSNEGDGSTFYFTIPASYEHDAYDETETETDT